MTSRLLAFALAMLIGSPTCWCCGPHRTSAEKVASSHGCCQQAESEEEGAPSVPSEQQDQCPCSLSQTKRDLAQSRVIVPAADNTAPSLKAHGAAESGHSTPHTVRLRATLADALPPWRDIALYRRHCALLL